MREEPAVRLDHRDDEFSLGVSFAEIPESVCGLIKGIRLLDDGHHLSRFEKFSQQTQILSVHLRHEPGQSLTPDLRSKLRPEQARQGSKPVTLRAPFLEECRVFLSFNLSPLGVFSLARHGVKTDTK